MRGDSPWRRHARRVSRVAGDSARDALRWQRVEISVLVHLAAGLALALPVVFGVVADRVPEGMIACLGALVTSSSARAGDLAYRIGELLQTTAAGTVGVALGVACGAGHGWPPELLIPAAGIAAVLGGIAPVPARLAVQGTVFMLIGASLPEVPPDDVLVVSFAAGGVAAGLLTLIAVGFELHVRHRSLTPAPPPRVVRDDLRNWLRRLRTLDGWLYPMRLTLCLAVGLALVEHLHERHSFWVLLTVAIVVQRDHRAAFGRTVQRGVGTALGVLVGGLVLAVPIGVTVAMIGVIGAVRPYLKNANYVAYTIVMTPLVVVLQGMGSPMPVSLLVERVVDTAIGCLISLLLGIAIWLRPLRRQSPSTALATRK